MTMNIKGFLVFILVWLIVCCLRVESGCRDQPRDECEKICRPNLQTGINECELRTAVILPNSAELEVSHDKVNPKIFYFPHTKLKSLS